MSTSKTALVVGVTGLVGGELLKQLEASPRYAKVVCLVRRDAPASTGKVQFVQVDFDNLEVHAKDLIADDVFCCLGTTIKKAGSKGAFRTVDYHYPVQVAKLSKANGARQFLIVSALSANKNSSVFYSKVKGETDDAVSSLGFRTVHILRPSLLLGPRKEKRLGEDVAKVVFKIFGFLVPKKYEGIHGATVARAMLTLAATEEPGIFFHSSAQLQKYRS